MDDVRSWLPRCLAMAAFVLYVMAAPPGFYWGDAAELSAAVVALGVPESTGFPLYCIVARAASLVPVGELAFRIELLGAACGALAVFWVTRLVIEQCRGDGHALVGAAVAGALLAMSAVLLRQATVAAVYAPTAALLAGGLLLLDQVSRGGDARWGLALALLCGLSLALHVGAWLLVPVAVALMGVRLYRGARWPLLAPLVALAMAGAALAYLPVRSASGGAAVLDRGHAGQASALLAHVTPRAGEGGGAGEGGERVGEGEGAGGKEAGEGGERVGEGDEALPAPSVAGLIEDTADRLGPVAPLAALLGLVWLARQRRSRWLAAALIAIAAGDLLHALLLDPAGQADWQNGVPLAVVVSAGAGAAVAWLSRFLGSAGPFAGAVAGVLLVVPPALVSVPAVWPASAPAGAPGHGLDAPRAWAEAALAATPPRGLAVVQRESTAAGLLYLTEVEGARPDIAVLPRRLLADHAYVNAVLARAGVDTSDLDPRAGPSRLLAWLLARERPVAWELGRDGVPAGMDVRIAAPLVTLVRRAGRDRASDHDAIAAALRTLERVFAGAGGRDHLARREHGRALGALARAVYARGEPALAVELLERALALDPDQLDPATRARLRQPDDTRDATPDAVPEATRDE